MRIHPDPMPGAIDQTHDPHPAWFYSRSAELKLAWLAKTHPRGRMLEIGCGDGYFLEAARRRGYEVSGIEPDPARAQRTREQFGIRVQAGFVEDVEPIEPAFDIVYHCDLLSHFADPALAFKRMASMLRPGGILFFEAGVYGNISRFWYRRMPEESFPRHRRILSPENVSTFLNACGLRVIRKKRYGLGPHILAYQAAVNARRALRRLASPDKLQPPHASQPGHVEHPFVQQVHTFMRYGAGALTPAWGPATMLVIAAPDGNRLYGNVNR